MDPTETTPENTTPNDDVDDEQLENVHGGKLTSMGLGVPQCDHPTDGPR